MGHGLPCGHRDYREFCGGKGRDTLDCVKDRGIRVVGYRNGNILSIGLIGSGITVGRGHGGILGIDAGDLVFRGPIGLKLGIIA